MVKVRSEILSLALDLIFPRRCEGKTRLSFVLTAVVDGRKKLRHRRIVVEELKCWLNYLVVNWVIIRETEGQSSVRLDDLAPERGRDARTREHTGP